MNIYWSWDPSTPDYPRGSIFSRLLNEVALLSLLAYQTRGVCVGRGRWLAMIARYQFNSGGRASLADRGGSHSQRAAARTLRRGAVWSILMAILASGRYILRGKGD